MIKKFLLLGLMSDSIVHEAEANTNRNDEFTSLDTRIGQFILAVYEGTFNSEAEAFRAGIALMENTNERQVRDTFAMYGERKYVWRKVNTIYFAFEIKIIFVKE